VVPWMMYDIHIARSYSLSRLHNTAGLGSSDTFLGRFDLCFEGCELVLQLREIGAATVSAGNDKIREYTPILSEAISVYVPLVHLLLQFFHRLRVALVQLRTSIRHDVPLPLGTCAEASIFLVRVAPDRASDSLTLRGVRTSVESGRRLSLSGRDGEGTCRGRGG